MPPPNLTGELHLGRAPAHALFIGFFATGVGLLESGSWDQLGKQALGAGVVLAFSFIASLIIGFIIEKTIGFRVKAEDEIAGIDTVVHGEEAYAFGADRG